MLETAFDLLVVNLTKYLGSNIFEVEWLTNAIYIVAFTILLILILLIFFIIVKLEKIKARNIGYFTYTLAI